jgi:hypothetical protein
MEKGYPIYTAITYVGKTPGIVVRINKKFYEFEWQKSLGVGGRSGEIDIDSALKLSQRRDRRGKKIFKLE